MAESSFRWAFSTRGLSLNTVCCSSTGDELGSRTSRYWWISKWLISDELLWMNIISHAPKQLWLPETHLPYLYDSEPYILVQMSDHLWSLTAYHPFVDFSCPKERNAYFQKTILPLSCVCLHPKGAEVIGIWVWLTDCINYHKSNPLTLPLPASACSAALSSSLAQLFKPANSWPLSSTDQLVMWVLSGIISYQSRVASDNQNLGTWLAPSANQNIDPRK